MMEDSMKKKECTATGGFKYPDINKSIQGKCKFNEKFKDNKIDYWFQKDWGGAILNIGSVLCNNCSFVGNYAMVVQYSVRVY